MHLPKSRPLAAQLAEKRRIRTNWVPVNKPHYRLRPSDVLAFPQGRTIRVVQVLALDTRRGPASEAQTLYESLADQYPLSKELVTRMSSLRAPAGSEAIQAIRMCLDRHDRFSVSR